MELARSHEGRGIVCILSLRLRVSVWGPYSPAQDPAVVEKLQAGINRTAAVLPGADDGSSRWTPEAIEDAVSLEAEMQLRDAEEAAKADARNALESFILQVCVSCFRSEYLLLISCSEKP
jgi:hypothetical protein